MCVWVLTNLQQHGRHKCRLHGIAELSSEHDGAVHHPSLQGDALDGPLACQLLAATAAAGAGAAPRSRRSIRVSALAFVRGTLGLRAGHQ